MTNEPKILLFDVADGYQLQIKEARVEVISYKQSKDGQVLKQVINPCGYATVKLVIDGKRRTKLVHRLVAHAVLGPCPDGYVVNHRDGTKLNNEPENLEYCTIAANIHHAIKMGLHVSCDPTRMPTYSHGRCMADRDRYKHEWYVENAERIKARNRARYLLKKSEILSKQKEYYSANKVEIAKRSKARYERKKVANAQNGS